jgi:hypothetical protein
MRLAAEGHSCIERSQQLILATNLAAVATSSTARVGVVTANALASTVFPAW